MDLDEQALPLTRGQLDRWRAQEIGGSGAAWKLRAALFETDGRLYRRPVDYLNFEVLCHGFARRG